MSTIKDIARLAGVSHGTVSNVLNGRGNVSSEKIRRVEQAATQLGYQLNLQAKFLKSGRANTISVILPNITTEHYASLYQGLNEHFTMQGYELSLYLTQDQQALEHQYIQRIATKRDFAVIAVSCLTDAEYYYQSLKTDEAHIIFVFRHLYGAKQYLSLDFEQAGVEIADTLMAKGYHRLGLFSENQQNTHSQSLKAGLTKQFAAHNYLVEWQHIHSTGLDNTYSLAFEFFTRKNSLPVEVIITSDIERAKLICNAQFLGSTQLRPPIYTLANDALFYADNIYPYHMNYGMLSQQIVELLEHKKPQEYLSNKGFSVLASNSKKGNTQTQLEFLILPSPSTEALKKLLPHFERTSGIAVKLDIRPFDEIFQILNQLDKHPHYDLIRIDMAGLSWFAELCLQPLSRLTLDTDTLLSHYPPQLIERYSSVNNIAYAIPFDPSIQMLFYRKDLFNDASLKRLYYERYHHALTLPTSFAEFTQIATFFSQLKQSGLPAYGSCITIGNPEIIASEFLVRYYALNGTLLSLPQTLSLQPVIAEQVLKGLRTELTHSRKLESSWWDTSVRLFAESEVSMIIVYMNLFCQLAHHDLSPLIGYAPVPGNKPLLGGGSIGMSKYSQRYTQVSEFFEWLFSPDIAEQIVLLDGVASRDNIYQNQTIMANYPWLKLAQQTHYQGVRENSITGQASINLRRAENIIGRVLQHWLHHELTHQQAITRINCQLQAEQPALLRPLS